MSPTGLASVVVVDSQKLRQAGIVRLLETWADEAGLEIAPVSPLDEMVIEQDCAMVVLSLGGNSITESQPQSWIGMVRSLHRDVPLVVLSECDCTEEVRAAFNSGATGFIPTDLDPALALEALTFIHRGGSYFPTSVLFIDGEAGDAEDRGRTDADLRTGLAQADGAAVPLVERAALGTGIRVAQATAAVAGPKKESSIVTGRNGARLTRRQREVLERLGQGKPNKVIARDLNMTEATVKVHVRQIMQKFGVSNRTQAALRAKANSAGEQSA